MYRHCEENIKEINYQVSSIIYICSGVLPCTVDAVNLAELLGSVAKPWVLLGNSDRQPVYFTSFITTFNSGRASLNS